MQVFYLFLVSFLSLLSFFFLTAGGLNDLATTFFGMQEPGLACWPNLLGPGLVAGALWWLHWRRFSQSEERSKGEHRGLMKFHLFVQMLALVMGSFLYASRMVSSVFSMLEAGSRLALWRDVAGNLMAFILALLLWIYHFRFSERLEPQKAKK